MAQLSNTERDELISPTLIAVGQKVVVPVARVEQERRIYCFVDTKTTGDFFLAVNVKCLDQGSLVASYWLELLSDTAAVSNRSAISQFAAGGAAIGDTLVITLAKPFDPTVPQVVLQPFRVNLPITHVVAELVSFSGLISGWRCFVGCTSTKY